MIQVENLTKYYGLNRALEDVSFSVGAGEVVGFLGPNAAGKTTTLKIITCFMPPTRGRVLVDGHDASMAPLRVRSLIGYLPENVPLYREMTVSAFLRFAAEVKGLDRAARARELDRVMEVCHLTERRDSIIGRLSKGFRQRVGIAQALIGDPRILILDEPTIGLDPAQTVEIRKLILSLGEDHTILLSSHILPEVKKVCDRVVIINKGRIVATDTAANLAARMKGAPKVIVKVGKDGPSASRLIAGVPGVESVSILDDEGTVEVEVSRGADARAEMARRLVEGGFDLKELRSQEVTLEDVFMHLVTEEEETS